MNLIIHKCVCNVMTVPNLTQYIKFDKHIVKTKQIGIDPKFVRNADFTYFCCCVVLCCVGVLTVLVKGLAGFAADAALPTSLSCYGYQNIAKTIYAISAFRTNF